MKIEYCQNIRKSDFADILENFVTSHKKSHDSRLYPRLWPLEEPTLFPRRWVSLTSRFFFAKSFTIGSFCEDIVEEHRAWNSGFKEGLSFSRRKTDNSLAAWPNKATTSTLFVGALKSDILMSVPAFFKVAKLDFCRACCIFANRRSVFLLNALRNCQISGGQIFLHSFPGARTSPRDSKPLLGQVSCSNVCWPFRRTVCWWAAFSFPRP